MHFSHQRGCAAAGSCAVRASSCRHPASPHRGGHRHRHCRTATTTKREKPTHRSKETQHGIKLLVAFKNNRGGDSLKSEQIGLASNDSPLPPRHLIKSLSAHAKDRLKLRVAQPALAVVGADAGWPRHACAQLFVRPSIAATLGPVGRKHGVRRGRLLYDLSDEREPLRRSRELLLLGAKGRVELVS